MHLWYCIYSVPPQTAILCTIKENITKLESQKNQK